MFPAAPTIDSVTPGDTQLKVAWTAPAGETGITAYDVRHIETSEDETDDTKWTVVDNAWASGVRWNTPSTMPGPTAPSTTCKCGLSTPTATGRGPERRSGTPALPAPTIGSVRAQTTAPCFDLMEHSHRDHLTGVEAYDVRYIETSADEMQWTPTGPWWRMPGRAPTAV